MQKYSQLETIAYKYDLQSRKTQEIQAQLKDRDNQVNELQNVIKDLEKELENINGKNKSVVPSSRDMFAQVSKSIDMPLQRLSHKIQRTLSDQEDLVPRQHKPMIEQNHKIYINTSAEKRCITTQTKMIEELIIEKQNLQQINDTQKSQLDLLEQNLANILVSDFKLEHSSQNLDSKLQSIKSEIQGLQEQVHQSKQQSQQKPQILDYDNTKQINSQHNDNITNENQKLSLDLKHSQLKCENLEYTLKQLQQIFDSQTTDDTSDNDLKILNELQKLSQEYVNQYLDQVQIVENLKEQIRELEKQINQNEKNLNMPCEQKQSNQFKRKNAGNTAIKKVQGFLQQQMNQQQHQQTAPKSSRTTAVQNDTSMTSQSILMLCSETNLLFKSVQDQENVMLNESRINHKQDDHSITTLKDQVTQLNQDKSLLSLEIKELKDKYLKDLYNFPALNEKVLSLTQQNSNLQENQELLKMKIEDLESQIEELKQKEITYTQDYKKLVQKYEESNKIVQNMQGSQSELKKLIDEEREAYNEDRERYESDLEKIKQMTETKIKIIKTKLIALYDGNLDNAKNLSIEEIIDHVSFRLTQQSQISQNIQQRRGNSLQNKSAARPFENQGYIQQSQRNQIEYQDTKMAVQDSKVMTNHRRYSCMQPAKQARSNLTTRENSQNTKEQAYQQMINNMSKDKSNNMTQDQMTKIIELCQVQNLSNQNLNQETFGDFIKSNISPIKRQQYTQEDQTVTLSTIENIIDSKENRIIAVENVRQARENRRQNLGKQSAFLTTNMNHQNINYHQVKPSTIINVQNKENPYQISNMFNINKRKPLHCSTQSTTTSLVSPFSQYDMPRQMPNMIDQQQFPVKATMNCALINNQNTLNRNTPYTANIQTSQKMNKGESQQKCANTGSNENLSSIIENFKREKVVFNQKFQELKQKLETYSSTSPSKRMTNRESSASQRNNYYQRNEEEGSASQRQLQSNDAKGKINQRTNSQNYEVKQQFLEVGHTPIRKQPLTGYE